MDPDANLNEQRGLAALILKKSDDGESFDAQDAIRLAELVQALDEWINGHGFLPSRWQR